MTKNKSPATGNDLSGIISADVPGQSMLSELQREIHEEEIAAAAEMTKPEVTSAELLIEDKIEEEVKE